MVPYISTPFPLRLPLTTSLLKYDSSSQLHGNKTIFEVVALHEATVLRVLGRSVIVDERSEKDVAATECVAAQTSLLHEEIGGVLRDFDAVQRVVDVFVRNVVSPLCCDNHNIVYINK